MKYCQKCGTPNDADVLVCRNCGNRGFDPVPTIKVPRPIGLFVITGLQIVSALAIMETGIANPVLGVVYLPLGGIILLVALALFTGRNWARRISMLLLLVLGLINGYGILLLLITAVYLMKPNVKLYFKQPKTGATLSSPRQELSQRPSMPSCIVCGHQIDQGAEFCTSCGASQTQAPVLTARDHINKGDSLFDEAAETRSEAKYKEALKEYDRAIRMDRTEPYAHLRKGETLKCLQDFQEKPKKRAKYEHKAQDEFRRALKLYQDVLAREPNNTELHFNASIAFDNLGDKEAALREMDQVVRLDNSEAIYHYIRALLLIQLYRSEESLLATDLALNLEPTNAEFAVFKVETLAVLERSDEASKVLDEFLKVVDPKELLAAIEYELMKQDLETNIRKVLEPFYFREALKMARAVKPSELLR